MLLRLFLKTQDEISAVLVTKERVFEAGNPIVLDFKLNTSVRTQLFIHSSFGSNVIDPDTHDTARFTVPEFMAKKKGLVSYTLLGESGSLYEGEIRIISNTKTKVHLESYIGPPSIIAGEKIIPCKLSFLQILLIIHCRIVLQY